MWKDFCRSIRKHGFWKVICMSAVIFFVWAGGFRSYDLKPLSDVLKKQEDEEWL